ncbi:MAG: polysaccharide biosynthesis protein [Gallionellaceae bacterium]|jgi:FlaA1/EpsC-like NDP-sugar epimerase|nr:polysaccharide biosynthesis protein [Gallionellaceae bacterium]
MNPKGLLVFLHDVLATAAMWLVAYWLRFNFNVPPEAWDSAWEAVLWVTPVYAAIYLLSGLHRGMWRYASMDDVRSLLVSVMLGAVVVAAIGLMAHPLGGAIPRAVFVMHPLLLLAVMAGNRYLYRAWKDGYLSRGAKQKGIPVVVLGAGVTASKLSNELARTGLWQIKGFFDDNADKRGRYINGIEVLGNHGALIQHVRRLGVRHAIIAMPSATAAQRRQVAEKAVQAELTVLTVPSFTDILSGRVSISNVRKVELEDLLGREAVQLDKEGLHHFLTDKVVMVTGAGGSIGAELARQIIAYKPRLLVFYELSEVALYAIEQEFSGKSIACVIGDVKDKARLSAVFEKFQPAIVFHAAAYKHVPLMENGNAWSAVRNNVLGTYCVADAAIRYGCPHFVLISTDKAVNPTNVMGASKRLAEMVCQSLQTRTTETHFVMVRFGNVLGSSGSVIPKFREQIAGGGPVTVTHPEIIRYFMLIPEAAQLVLQAGMMGQGGEIFVLDMGEPVRIADLARDMVHLSGFTEEDIRIEFTGLRPGEKLFEELLADDEATSRTSHPKLRIVKSTRARDTTWLGTLLAWLETPIRDEIETQAGLQERVPEYQPAVH